MEERDELKTFLSLKKEICNKRLFIWGTGNTASLYQEGLKRLVKEKIVICGYVDNDCKKWGNNFFNKKILSPEELMQEKNVLVLITSPQPIVIRAVSKQLDDLGLEWIHIDEYILKLHLKEVLEVYDLFEDDYDRRLYSELIHCRIEGRYPSEKYISNEQYFSFRDFVNSESKDVFVDCGAYVGDTIEQYIWKTNGQFSKYIAFEPDSKNVDAMNYRVDRLKREWNIPDDKILIYPYAIGEKNSVSYVERYSNNNGLGSKIVDSYDKDDADEIKSVSIDEFLNEKVSFLKADIESYEYKMLLGAKKTIKKYNPKLAICIYHNVVDFYQIPLLIKKICPNYCISIRHYTNRLSDTVLYAYVSEND